MFFMRSSQTVAAGIMAALAIVSPAMATDPVYNDGIPRVWSWNPVLGDATADARFQEMLRYDTRYPASTSLVALPRASGSSCAAADKHSGCRAADVVVKMIKDRRQSVSNNTAHVRYLKDGRIAICLTNAGMGGLTPNAWNATGSRPNSTFDPTNAGNLQDPYPAIFWHPLDRVHDQHGEDTLPDCLRPWNNLWMTEGIAEAQAWMADFIAEYKEWQDDLSGGATPLPDPDRFIFDSEPGWTLGLDSAKTACGGGPDIAITYELWLWMKADPRYTTAPIPGFGGDTLEDLFDASGLNDPEFPSSWNWSYLGGSLDNQLWFYWIRSVSMQAQTAAFDEAFYQQIRVAFPDCKSSNYGSAKMDGQDAQDNRTGDDDINGYITGVYHDAIAPVCDVGGRLVGVAPDDQITPSIYPDANNEFYDKPWVTSDRWISSCTCSGTIPSDEPLESPFDASYRLHRHNLDASIHYYQTYTGAPTGTVSPWISPVMTSWRDGYDEYRQGYEDTRRTLMLARTREADEFILWSSSDLYDGEPNPDKPYTWSAMKDMIGQVWSFAIDNVATNVGDWASGADQTNAWWSLAISPNNTTTVESTVSMGVYSNTGLDVTFDNAYGEAEYITVMIEARSDKSSDLHVYVKKPSTTLVEFDANPEAAGTNPVILCADNVRRTFVRMAATSDMFGAGDAITIRLVNVNPSTGSAMTTDYELIQVCASDPLEWDPDDFNNDGYVDLTDMQDFKVPFHAAFGKTYGQGGFNASVDANRDGSIDRLDWNDYYCRLAARSVTLTSMCRVDYNHDGSVNSADMTAYVIDYMNNSLKADMDCSGTIESGDLTDFTTLHGLGC